MFTRRSCRVGIRALSLRVPGPARNDRFGDARVRELPWDEIKRLGLRPSSRCASRWTRVKPSQYTARHEGLDVFAYAGPERQRNELLLQYGTSSSYGSQTPGHAVRAWAPVAGGVRLHCAPRPAVGAARSSTRRSARLGAQNRAFTSTSRSPGATASPYPSRYASRAPTDPSRPQRPTLPPRNPVFRTNALLTHGTRALPHASATSTDSATAVPTEPNQDRLPMPAPARATTMLGSHTEDGIMSWAPRGPIRVRGLTRPAARQVVLVSLLFASAAVAFASVGANTAQAASCPAYQFIGARGSGEPEWMGGAGSVLEERRPPS